MIVEKKMEGNCPLSLVANIQLSIFGLVVLPDKYFYAQSIGIRGRHGGKTID